VDVRGCVVEHTNRCGVTTLDLHHHTSQILSGQDVVTMKVALTNGTHITISTELLVKVQASGLMNQPLRLSVAFGT